MYRSPIELIYGDITTKINEETEDFIYEAVRKVGIDVDKEELLKALQYDRHQYSSGYCDGYTEGVEAGKRQTLELLRRFIEDGNVD